MAKKSAEERLDDIEQRIKQLEAHHDRHSGGVSKKRSQEEIEQMEKDLKDAKFANKNE